MVIKENIKHFIVSTVTNCFFFYKITSNQVVAKCFVYLAVQVQHTKLQFLGKIFLT